MKTLWVEDILMVMLTDKPSFQLYQGFQIDERLTKFPLLPKSWDSFLWWHLDKHNTSLFEFQNPPSIVGVSLFIILGGSHSMLSISVVCSTRLRPIHLRLPNLVPTYRGPTFYGHSDAAIPMSNGNYCSQ